MVSSQNKTPPNLPFGNRGRNEEVCEQSRGVVAVPVVVKPVVVTVPRTIVEIQIADVEVVGVRVAIVYRVPSMSLPP